MRRRQHQTSKGRLNFLQESCRRKLAGVQELPEETKRGSVQCLGGGETRIILRNETEAEHDQGKVVKPVWTC